MDSTVPDPADSPAVTAFQLGMDAGAHEQQRRARLAVEAATGEPFEETRPPSIRVRITAAWHTARREFRNPRGTWTHDVATGIAIADTVRARIHQIAGA